MAGLDYAESGCTLARKRLAAEGVDGTIYCEDFFCPHVDLVERFDFVYSLGVAEHFDDTANALSAISRFVKPGGYVLTEIPNMYYSLTALLSKVWQPDILAKHVRLSCKQLAQAHEDAGLVVVEKKYTGVFSLGMVAWGVAPRWPRLEKRMLPFITKAVGFVEQVMNRFGRYDPIWPSLAPFTYVIAQKRNAESR